MFSKQFYKAFLVCAAIFASQAQAQDANLYAAPPPADAAFVRAFGFDGVVQWNQFELSGERIEGDYSAFHSGDVEGVETSAFLTLVPSDDGMTVLDEPVKSAAKVTIGLINLMQSPITLKTSDGNVDIIEETLTSQANWREVNPISVSVQVFGNETSIGDTIDFTLQRNTHPTIVVGADATVNVVESNVLPGVLE